MERKRRRERERDGCIECKAKNDVVDREREREVRSEK